MHQLKPITLAGVPAALQKANRYRLLNDSVAAVSICQDILAVDPNNTEAIVTHVLAISDQFAESMGDTLARAREAVAHIADPYRNAYYNGIICERWARAILRSGALRGGEAAHDWLTRAMEWYERAEKLRTPGNDEAILRWNTCVRLLERRSDVRPRESEAYEPGFE